jgi:uncharacterized protein YcbK (DUF882 family)
VRSSASALAALALAAAAGAAEPARFFVAGDGRLALANAHTGVTADVRYRDADGRYPPDALRRLRQVFAREPGVDGPMALRLVEVLSRLQAMAGGRPLALVSGYRSAAFNEKRRAEGAKAAAGSLHTEGLAADVAFPRSRLAKLWLGVRALDCCGAGYYAKDGFLHVDVGRPRFWEAGTSRVEDNLSAGNARLFARTEYDRYAEGEAVVVTLHAMTRPPVRLAPTARFAPAGPGHDAVLRVEGEGEPDDGCLVVREAGGAVRIAGVAPGVRGRIVLATCPPRAERTPERVETNPIEVEPFSRGHPPRGGPPSPRP